MLHVMSLGQFIEPAVNFFSSQMQTGEHKMLVSGTGLLT